MPAALLIAALAAQAHAQEGQADAPAGKDAPPADDDARAREQFKQGQAAYEQGDYRSAWEHFHRAYMLSKRPELLYNVGQTADRLRRDREALKAFRMYLQRLPDAENRREVENRVRVLEERVAELEEEEGQAARDDEGDIFRPVNADERPFQSVDETPEAQDEAAAPPPPPDAGGEPIRKGWYFRGALGLGGFRASVSAPVAGASDTTLTSSTASGEIGVGHAIMPGIVVGGAIFFDYGLAPKVGDLEIDRANLTMFGALIDWYLRPDQDGLHLEGGVALGSLSKREAGGAPTVSQEAATGGALLAGGGYEWPLTDAWALGVLGRLTVARVSDDVSDFTLFAISAQASATWF